MERWAAAVTQASKPRPLRTLGGSGVGEQGVLHRIGWHYLSNATCLIRPQSFYAVLRGQGAQKVRLLLPRVSVGRSRNSGRSSSYGRRVCDE